VSEYCPEHTCEAARRWEKKRDSHGYVHGNGNVCEICDVGGLDDNGERGENQEMTKDRKRISSEWRVDKETKEKSKHDLESSTEDGRSLLFP
jgi:hypothetical protein